MTTPVVVGAAVVSGLLAVGLTAWIRPMLGERSTWLHRRPHAVLAVLGGAGAAALAQSWPEVVAFALLVVAGPSLAQTGPDISTIKRDQERADEARRKEREQEAARRG